MVFSFDFYFFFAFCLSLSLCLLGVCCRVVVGEGIDWCTGRQTDTTLSEEVMWMNCVWCLVMNRSRCPKGAEDKGAVVRPKGTWHIQQVQKSQLSPLVWLFTTTWSVNEAETTGRWKWKSEKLKKWKICQEEINWREMRKWQERKTETIEKGAG